MTEEELREAMTTVGIDDLKVYIGKNSSGDFYISDKVQGYDDKYISIIPKKLYSRYKKCEHESQEIQYYLEDFFIEEDATFFEEGWNGPGLLEEMANSRIKAIKDLT